MNRELNLHLCWIGLLVMTSGCITHTPRPHRFLETTNSPGEFIHYAGWSDGAKLLLDVAPRYSAPTFYGINAFKEGDNLYLYSSYDSLMAFTFDISTMHSKLHSERQWIKNGTNGVLRFTIDTGRYGMQSDWPSHVYWLMETGTYWFPGRRFWSDTRRDPAVRRQIGVRPL